jgi:two-component system, OmpR family, alkaline phosphatase synthesis response regulator PhoP
MSKKIIIIDDDPDIVESMKIVLEKEGYIITTAPNGKDGMEKIKNDRPNLILLDVMMNTKDEGFEVSYKLKSDPELKNIPIIMITSVSQVTGFEFNKERDGDFIPVDDFVEKPVKPKNLIDIVRRNLGE